MDNDSSVVTGSRREMTIEGDGVEGRGSGLPRNAWFLRARLRTRHLMLLSAIGEEGNICRAAQLLSMSQPAASRLLRELEEIVGVDLFERLPRGVRANGYGEAMVRHARNALSSLAEAATEIEALKAGRTGCVNLGAIAGAAARLVPDAVLRVTREHPRVRIQVTVDTSERLVESLHEGRIDVFVGRLPAGRASAGFTFQRLGDEPAAVAVRVGHPLLSTPRLPLSRLTEATWVVPPLGTALRQRFRGLFEQHGLDVPERLVETASPTVVARLLADSDCIALQPRDVIDHYVDCDLMAALPIDVPAGPAPIGVIARQGSVASPAVKWLSDALVDAAANSSSPRSSTLPD